jgi:hypothetical protein
MSMVTFDADSRTEAALAELMAEGQSPDEVIRQAILVAWRLRRSEVARHEAEVVALDAADRAEARAIMRDMESLRAR